MTDRPARGSLSTEDLATLLEVTRSLAAPFDLHSMLAAVTAAARQVLRAERCSVWLHDAAAGELVLEVSSDNRPPPWSGRPECQHSIVPSPCSCASHRRARATRCRS